MRKMSVFSLIIVLSLFVVFHFLIILLSVGPSNPISMANRPFLIKYTSIFFVQNWHLFAPEPIKRNSYVFLQVKKANGVDNKEDQWIDLTTPIINKNNEDPFTPYNRIVRIIEGMVTDYYGQHQDEYVVEYMKAIEKNKDTDQTSQDEIVKIIKNEEKTKKKRGEEELYRYASSYVKAVYPNESVEAIRVRVMIYDTIPFSKRNEANFDPKIIDDVVLDWKKVDEEVIKLF
ncbi:hypothetical protein GCM10008018_13370 [Paenibacillus marchantiophytorum]|uniref:Uncharacterized protein n=1 Tax=Paenibacillus marchantiophytorum TaxID=1619310 RepID=A0ABQ2BVP8_9BACL|nr:DUF5819 family protein [Paenibacillus marchantiophytorum]GGI45680.1 hypothetical protein GCM10008018_13370 [Paenibacillus marchantiophytorum]